MRINNELTTETIRSFILIHIYPQHTNTKTQIHTHTHYAQTFLLHVACRSEYIQLPLNKSITIVTGLFSLA